MPAAPEPSQNSAPPSSAPAGAGGGVEPPVRRAKLPLVQVRDLHKVFLHGGRKLAVLCGIDLDLGRGEMLSVVGISGAGKSTMLHILGALDRPTQGKILFGGKDLVRMSSAQLAAFRNRSIGFVFQFHHLLPEFTALENVMMPGLIQRLPRVEASQQASELLIAVGLGDRMAHRPGELSGGEQQRVALARALVMKPALLLADEPTGNLDSRTSGAIHELFFELNERLNTTMLIVTHNHDLAQRMPRQLKMVDGRLLEDGEGRGPGDPRLEGPAGLATRRDERRADSDERRADSDEPRADSDEPRVDPKDGSSAAKNGRREPGGAGPEDSGADDGDDREGE